MKALELAKLLGGTVYGQWINIAGPGHRSKDRSLGIKFDPSAPDGFWVHSLAGDDWAKCRQYVKDVLKGLKLNAKTISSAGRVDHRAAERIARALKMWEHASPAEGTLVDKYLNWRGCTLSSAVKSADALRFHPFCRFGPERLPAMIGLMWHLVTDEPTGIHLTVLNHGGKGKRELPGGAKRMLGVAAQAAVKLQPHNGVLGIAEGIETALSASQRYGVPVWALLSAGTIRASPIIPGVRRLIIFADHDAAGLAAAYECARRYSSNGIPAEIRHPKPANADFNDLLQQETKKCR